MSFADALSARFGDRVCSEATLAPYTTFKVGGPAEWFVETRDATELLDAIRLAGGAGMKLTILGGGSNVLIGDRGIRGLVIRPRGGRVEQIGPREIRVDAPVTINGLVRWTINHGVAGLEAWAGTPGTVGGAIFGNAHFGGRLIGELVSSVRIADEKGATRDLSRAEMEFGYDRSRLQRTHEVVLSAVFSVTTGDPAALRDAARQSLAYRKKTQPLETPSAGCIFQNPSGAQVPREIPPSAGALVDRAGLKGTAIGGARVSVAHANFIVNEGRATAADIRALIEMCRESVREKFGVTLKDEIVYLGDFQNP